MCAIFGIIGDYDSQKAHDALALMRHRGPDDGTALEQERLFLGHRRLAIVDPETKFAQPMRKEGVYALFNGEIYNYRALKEALAGYSFETQGDSEVVLAAYLAWGEAFVERLEGMFAIAIVDGGKVLLFRDRMGEKPLYYSLEGDQLLFASELKSLVAYTPQQTIDRDALHCCLMLQAAVAPMTMYRGIFALEPGSVLRWESGAASVTLYDDILPKRIIQEGKAEALVSIEEKLRESIEKRIETEVPLGFLLSGGVDSSLVCAMAQKMSPQPIETFTLGYREFERYDERAFAATVARHIGSKHEEILFGFEEFKAVLTRSLEALDEPINDPASIPLYYLFERLGRDYKKRVILSGEGSDELFMGYRPYLELLEIEKLRDFGPKNWLKNYFGDHYSPHREWEWYRRVWNRELLFRGTAESFTSRQLKEILSDKGKIADSRVPIEHLFERYEAHKGAYGREETKLWYRYIDLKVHQGDYFLKKLDRVSMAHSVEARAPFMEASLVKYVMSLEGDHFLEGGRTKNLLKDVALAYLPEEIVERKKKGFSYPFIEWMQRLDAWSEMRSINKRVQLFDPTALEVLIQGATKGKFKQHAFGVYTMLLWVQLHK